MTSIKAKQILKEVFLEDELTFPLLEDEDIFQLFEDVEHDKIVQKKEKVAHVVFKKDSYDLWLDQATIQIAFDSEETAYEAAYMLYSFVII